MSREDDRDQGNHAWGDFSPGLTSIEKKALIAVVAQKITAFNKAIEESVEGIVKAWEEKERQSVDVFAKIGSFASQKMHEIGGQFLGSRQGSPNSSCSEPGGLGVEKREQKKAEESVNLLSPLERYLTESLKASYLHMESLSPWGQIQVAFSPEKISSWGDVKCALLELKLLAKSVKSKRLRAKMVQLKSMKVLALMSGVFASLEPSSANDAERMSYRQNQGRLPADIAQLVGLLLKYIKEINQEIDGVFGEVPTEKINDFKQKVFLQLKGYLETEVEASYLKLELVSMLPEAPAELTLQLNKAAITCLDDLRYALREVMFFNLLAADRVKFKVGPPGSEYRYVLRVLGQHSDRLEKNILPLISAAAKKNSSRGEAVEPKLGNSLIRNQVDRFNTLIKDRFLYLLGDRYLKEEGLKVFQLLQNYCPPQLSYIEKVEETELAIELKIKKPGPLGAVKSALIKKELLKVARDVDSIVMNHMDKGWAAISELPDRLNTFIEGLSAKQEEKESIPGDTGRLPSRRESSSLESKDRVAAAASPARSRGVTARPVDLRNRSALDDLGFNGSESDQEAESGLELTVLGDKPGKPDLSDLVLVFRSAWSLTTALSFWSLLQGKTEKIRKARYGLDMLKSYLLGVETEQRLTPVGLLRDVTDTLFCHRIRQAAGPEQAAEEGMPVVTRSGEKFSRLLLLARNAYLRHLILEDVNSLCDNLEDEEWSCLKFAKIFLKNEESLEDFVKQSKEVFSWHKEDKEDSEENSAAMLKTLMGWAKIRYCLEHYHDRSVKDLEVLSHNFYGSNREGRILLAVTPQSDKYIADGKKLLNAN